MKHMYKASSNYRVEIIKVKVLKETDKCIYVETKDWKGRVNGNRRENKESRGHCYFNDWHPARDWLLERAKATISSRQRSLDSAKSELQKIQAMKKF